MRPDDTIEVIDFNSQVRIVQPFTSDVAALEHAIRGTTVNGSTSLYNAIYISLKELKRERARTAEEIRRQAIVVLSDGDDTSSLVQYDEVLDLAKRSETAIYAIGLRQSETGRTRFKEAEFVLRQLSQETGGRAFFPNTVAELPKIYQQISDELSSQYSIAYTSKNPMKNGAWRRIVVRVKTPGLHRPHAPGLLRPDRAVRTSMHLVPLLLYAAATATYMAHFAWRDQRVGRLADGDARRRRARAYVPHRHADDAGRARAARRHQRRDLGVRVAARPVVSLYRADDRRAIDGCVRRAADALRSTSFRRSIRRSTPRPPLLQSPLFTLHIMSTLFAYASFALACVLGITYVLLFKEIKAKHLGLLLRAAAVAAGARRDERARGHGRLDVPDARRRDRRHLGDADPRVDRSARAGHVVCRSEDPRRDVLLGCVLVRAVCAARPSAGAAAARRTSRRSPSRSCC